MEYKTQIFTDSNRNGVGLELVNSNDQITAEVFRYDSIHEVKICIYESSQDKTILEKFLRLPEKN